jgi:hypothetical protein
VTEESITVVPTGLVTSDSIVQVPGISGGGGNGGGVCKRANRDQCQLTQSVRVRVRVVVYVCERAYRRRKRRNHKSSASTRNNPDLWIANHLEFATARVLKEAKLTFLLRVRGVDVWKVHVHIDVVSSALQDTAKRLSGGVRRRRRKRVPLRAVPARVHECRYWNVPDFVPRSQETTILRVLVVDSGACVEWKRQCGLEDQVVECVQLGASAEADVRSRTLDRSGKVVVVVCLVSYVAHKNVATRRAVRESPCAVWLDPRADLAFGVCDRPAVAEILCLDLEWLDRRGG